MTRHPHRSHIIPAPPHLSMKDARLLRPRYQYLDSICWSRQDFENPESPRGVVKSGSKYIRGRQRQMQPRRYPYLSVYPSVAPLNVEPPPSFPSNELRGYGTDGKKNYLFSFPPVRPTPFLSAPYRCPTTNLIIVSKRIRSLIAVESRTLVEAEPWEPWTLG